MAWGSGSANFAFLVTPDTAIQNKVLASEGGSYQSILDNDATSAISALATQASVALVFVNADSGMF
jgi:beta-glucosidase